MVILIDCSETIQTEIKKQINPIVHVTNNGFHSTDINKWTMMGHAHILMNSSVGTTPISLLLHNAVMSSEALTGHGFMERRIIPIP